MNVGELVLDFPPVSKLGSNSRLHYRVKNKLMQSQKNTAWRIALAANYHRVEWPRGRLAVWIDGYPPNRIARDEDNFLAALKGALDGIARAMGVDDSVFVPFPMIHDEIRKPGEVRIKITAVPERL